MKKNFMVALAALCLMALPGKADAAGTSYKQETIYNAGPITSNTTGTGGQNLPNVPIPACGPGNVLNYVNNQYVCTANIQNQCADPVAHPECVGKTCVLTGNPSICQPLFYPENCQDVANTGLQIRNQNGTIAAGAGNKGYVQLGVTGTGHAICGFPLQPSCHVVYASNPNASGNFISYADCMPNEFLLTGGGKCAMPEDKGHANQMHGQTNASCYFTKNGGAGWGFMHRMQEQSDPHPLPARGDQSWMTTCYGDPRQLGGLPHNNGDANDCSVSYAVCCHYSQLDNATPVAPQGTGSGVGDFGNYMQNFGAGRALDH